MSTLRQTHTSVTLEISRETHDEIAGKLLAAGYDHAVYASGEVDMHGIVLVPVASKEGPRSPNLPLNEQFNDFCRERPCASEACRRAKQCLHS